MPFQAKQSVAVERFLKHDKSQIWQRLYKRMTFSKGRAIHICLPALQMLIFICLKLYGCPLVSSQSLCSLRTLNIVLQSIASLIKQILKESAECKFEIDKMWHQNSLIRISLELEYKDLFCITVISNLFTSEFEY